jgi:pSer/pThr/pTyr-binding forkhead associated (FHA) protein
MANQRHHLLVITEGPNQGRTYPLYEMSCTLGRAADNTVVFDSSRVSRHHAQVRLLPSGAIIEDLDSTNGTWLNGEQLTEPRLLSSGDQIRLADYVTLAYFVEAVGQDATVLEGASSPATQVLEDVRPPVGPSDGPRHPVPPDPIDPAPSPQSAYTPPAPSGYKEQPVPSAATPAPARRRSGWLYALIGLLLALICLCVALSVYLWFAPVTFWERVFRLVGIPMPSGMLLLLWSARWLFG